MEPATVFQNTCDALDEGDERLAREVLDHIADKWSIWVIYVLGSSGPLRFSRLMERVEGVSQKMLTKTLRTLERDGLVTRTMFMEVPPRVEYELTPTGRELVLRVFPFWSWIVESVNSFKAARERFDERASK